MLTLSKLFVSLLIAASLVQSHELAFNRRDHGRNRLLKKRSFAGLPRVDVVPSANSVASSAVSQSTASETPPQSQSTSLASTPAASIPASSSTSSTSSGTSSSQSSSSSIVSSSTPSSTNSSSTSTSTSQTSPSASLTPLPGALTVSDVASTITSTSSIPVNTSDTALPQAQSTSAKAKSTTVTVLIAVAASVGGIAILWTIFRKWKLSSSKEFDRRLNPITDWQPTNGDDDAPVTKAPALRRAGSSTSSFDSGGGSANGHGAVNAATLDHDFTPRPGNSAPIGGYADLARASSPNSAMRQTLGRGPSFNYGYDVNVPLHHQTGFYEYDRNGGPRY